MTRRKPDPDCPVCHGHQRYMSAGQGDLDVDCECCQVGDMNNAFVMCSCGNMITSHSSGMCKTCRYAAFERGAQ